MKKPWEFDNPLCAEIGADFFFLEEDGNMRSVNEYQKVRAMCRSCDHVFDCAEWGIAKEYFGVWGGLTPKERTAIRRKRRMREPSSSNDNLIALYLSKRH